MCSIWRQKTKIFQHRVLLRAEASIFVLIPFYAIGYEYRVTLLEACREIGILVRGTGLLNFISIPFSCKYDVRTHTPLVLMIFVVPFLKGRTHSAGSSLIVDGRRSLLGARGGGAINRW